MTGGRRRLVAALVACWVLAPTALAAATYPRWWSWIAPERTPMTWLQSVVLVLSAAGCLVVAAVLRRAGAGGARLWWILAAGFAALTIDERFTLHERVRDGYLAPRGVSLPFLPWVAPGDFLILGIAAVALTVLPALWRALRPDRAARGALALGVALAGVAVLMDSVDPSTWTIAQERVQQTLEEILELGSGLAFLAVVALRLLGLLDEHVRPPESAAPGPGPGGTDAENRLPGDTDSSVPR